MRFVLRSAVAVAAITLAVPLLFVTAATAGNKPGNSLNAHMCQQDGWQSLYTDTGATFASEDECVSYGARGGTIYSAVADVSLSAITWSDTVFSGVNVYVTNGGPSSVTVTVVVAANYGGVTSAPTILAPGETRFVGGLAISGGYTEIGYAQVTSATVHDPDSTPNNYTGGATGPAVEDDEVVFASPPPGS